MRCRKNTLALTKFIFLFSLLAFYGAVHAQPPPDMGAPKVFLDCQTRCFFEHIRSKLNYLNFMRDRQTADVYMQLTNFRTGSDGREWTLRLKGQGRFANMADTLVFYSVPNATDSQIQDLQVEKIQLALLPFILKTSLADRVKVKLLPGPEGEDSTGNIGHDPWDYWVFSLGGNVNFNGQESFKSLNARGRFNGSRVTDASKYNFSLSYDYSHNSFSLADEDFISETRRLDLWSIYVHSISDHWSAGAFASGRVSTVANIDLSLSLRPAIEFNVYPYSEATKRQFTFLYNIGPGYTNYTDTTIFDTDKEWLVRQDLEVGFRQLAEWGTLNLNIEFANYFHDWSLLNLSFNPEIEWNIFKGLNLELGGEISLVRDQLNIRKEGASNEEVLLQLRQLGTNYLYFGFIGLNYRFGSANNNVVNTRF